VVNFLNKNLLIFKMKKWMITIIISVIVLALTGGGYITYNNLIQNNKETKSDFSVDENCTIELAMEIQNENTLSLMNTDPGVVGTAIGYCQDDSGDVCIHVFLENDSPELKEKIPQKLGSCRVETEVTGEFVAG
jgi:flagellar basal body-associated protein FliL